MTTVSQFNPTTFYFEKSGRYPKKYVAIVRTPEGKVKRVHFGDQRYEQYRDLTGLSLYSHLDHNDPNRRRLYRLRHKSPGKPYSPGYFSWYYLWN